MAHWVIRLDDVFKPLMTLIREVQNASDYLQLDETRIQVLKEDGKTAQSDKWMWVSRGGPPSQPSVLFEYDPSRAGSVPERLLVGFNGTLQTDGYSGYAPLCKKQQLNHIGFRVDEDVTALIPHRPGRAQLTHPVLHNYCFAS